MKTFPGIFPILFVFAALAASASAWSATTAEEAKPAPAPSTPDLNVAILIFDDVQIIDFTGPYEVFGEAGFNVFTVAVSAAPVTTAMGMKVTPAYTLANAPAADVLVVPGGDVRNTEANPAVIAWLRERARPAKNVLTVCNGAFILAKTGLLDGLTATTFYDLIPSLREEAPKVHVVSDRRYADNGQIITTAGLSSGIDGALHVVERILGHGRAQQVALNMEYDWRPDSGFARASLADAELRRIFGRRLRLEVPGGESKVLSTEGTTGRWEVRWQVKTKTPLADLRAALTQRLAETGKWAPKAAAEAGASGEWTYKDVDQKTWTAHVDLAPEAGKDGEYRMVIRVERL
ncbi:MAG TPA: DJ-1/PfpI family protein [Thermoanaerobaculia bacterium]|jgi:putative intracellular protease/amidase|nr:DJ-1/PfpI family protein [Thermoanaerobaculia bacterium]